MALLNRVVYCHILQMIISTVGIVVSCFGFVAFKFHFKNQSAAKWALVSACMAASVLYLCLHFMYMKTKIGKPLPHNVFQYIFTLIALNMFFVAMFGMILGLLRAMEYYRIAYNSEGPLFPSITDLPYSQYTTSALCFLTFLWSLMMFGIIYSYRLFQHIEDQLSLVEDQQPRLLLIEDQQLTEDQQLLIEDQPLIKQIKTMHYSTFDTSQ